MTKQYLSIVFAAVLATAANAAAQTTLTQDQALRLAFPEPLKIERRTAYLDETQLARARQLAGGNIEVNQRVVTYYVALDSGRVAGTAYFDGHRVRTLREVLMLVINPEWKIERIEVLRFAEPPEYRAPDNWLDQFEGKRLSNDLTLKRSIVPMTGATLTANAVTSAARRTLALHAIISSSKNNDQD
jgi:Na+-translocating ferredoxin:NAD+ oxidoreductase RnfG subunit